MLWEKYVLSVAKFTCVATNFEFVVDDPDTWRKVGVEDSRVSLETMIELCLAKAHRIPVFEGRSRWMTLCMAQVDGGEEMEEDAIGSRLRSRDQKRL